MIQTCLSNSTPVGQDVLVLYSALLMNTGYLLK